MSTLRFTNVSSSRQCAARTRTMTVTAFASPWQTLGVAPGTDATLIKRAYRKLALQLHPDVNHAPDASARFMELQAAYDELCKGSEAQVWEPSPNHGQRGCRATWERQVAGLHQRPRASGQRGTRECNLAAQLAGLHRRRRAAGRA